MKQRNREAECVSGAGPHFDSTFVPTGPGAKTDQSVSSGSGFGSMTCETAQRAIALAALGTPDLFQVEPDVGSASVGIFGASADADGLDGMFAGAFGDTRARALSSTGINAAPAPAAEAHPGFPEDPFATASTGSTQSMAAAAVRRQEQDALAAHLSGCRSCQAEMAATTAFFRALAYEKGPEPSATLLARSRLQLDASLDSCEQHGPWTRITQQFVFTAGRLRAAPALSSALLLTGLLAGGYGGYRAGHAAHNVEQSTLLLAPPAPEVPSVVADVSSITRDNGTGLVEVRYDRLVPDVLTAPADDPSIRELLMAATENGTDPQVRNLSVNLLSNSCSPGAACDGTPVRNALLNVLGSDKTPGVRREALAGLQPYIASDMEVRDAVLAALMNDPSASVRIEAVRLLEPVDVDSSVRQALHTVAAEDGDPMIRSASLAALKTVPQVQ